MKLDSDLREQLLSLVEGEGLELLAVEAVGGGGHATLRLVVDGPDGVTLDDCACVSRQASALLDVEDPWSHRYTLEVSSPGLDRRLYSADDFNRFSGRQVRVKMKPGYRQHRLVVGQLLGRESNAVLVQPDDGETVSLPESEIAEARLDVDWSSVLKERKSRQ
jgi:ribosome maturation factor RimP